MKRRDLAQDHADSRFMRMAISLGARGLGRVWPNPAVGCVLVNDGRIVGRGWTQPGGRPHAERRALAQAGEAARGATAYVSLEPCAHFGQTPPCANALIEAGVSRVVTALTDPDPRVAGQGHKMLRDAGIAVTEGVESACAREANQGFLSRIERGRPVLTLKLALTLDARIATSSGASRWITGPQSRRHVHMMRATHDAVMVGVGTAMADDPDLRIRELGVDHQPVRIVVDSRLRLPPDTRLGRTARETPVWLLHGPEVSDQARAAWQDRGAVLIACPLNAEGRLDLNAAMALLGAHGLTRILCEGGGELAASLIKSDLVDELAIFSAGHLFGRDGLAGIGGLGVTDISPKSWTLKKNTPIGEDLLHIWSRKNVGAN